MEEKISFYTLTLLSYKKTFLQKTPWIFGSILSLVMILENKVFSFAQNIHSPQELWLLISHQTFHTLSIFLCIFIGFILLSVFARGNLIASLHFLLKNKKDSSHKKISLLKNMWTVFSIEAYFLLLFFPLASILLLPIFIPSLNNSPLIPLLTRFALITLLFCFLFFSLLKQFIFCYSIFSFIPLLTAFRLGLTLFRKHFFLSSLFFFFTLFLSGLFTFLVNIVILGTVALTQWIHFSWGEKNIETVSLFILFSFFAVFLQTLWILFFQSIAEPKEVSYEKKESAPSENIIPDIPQI